MLTDNQLRLVEYRKEISRLLFEAGAKLNEMCSLATQIERERAELIGGDE